VSDQELNDLLKSFDNPNNCYPQRLVDAIRLLVKERDEARREACGHGETIGGAMLEAELRGWDCYKDRADD
jgi:hypothetical protein